MPQLHVPRRDEPGLQAENLNVAERRRSMEVQARLCDILDIC
jgi:hypothetical protein